MTIVSALSLAHKAINTLESSRFCGSLSRNLWTGSVECEVRLAIQQKTTDELSRKLALFHRHNGCFDDLRGYLDVLAKAKNVKLRQSDKKGLLRDWRIDHYIEVRDFIYTVSAPYRPYVEWQSHQFELHELLWSLVNLLAIKDALENGTGIPKLDDIFTHLVETKTPSFFLNGYPLDLLVINRLCLTENPKVACIRTHRDYLSTLTLSAEESRTKDANALYFNVG
tara:strand:+ start:918 stop:1592 length:675 start_codon:yes stop_codon:yes gene_type:complete